MAMATHPTFVVDGEGERGDAALYQALRQLLPVDVCSRRSVALDGHRPHG